MEGKRITHKQMFKAKVREVILDGKGLPMPPTSNWDRSKHFFKSHESPGFREVIKRNRPTEFGRIMLSAAKDPKEIAKQTHDIFPGLLPTRNGPVIREADVLSDESSAVLRAVTEGMNEVGPPVPKWLGKIVTDLSALVSLSATRRADIEASRAAAWQHRMDEQARLGIVEPHERPHI